MVFSFSFFLVLIFFLFLPATDQQVLVDFYNGLDDRGLLEWNTTGDLCGQTAVTCDGAGRVSEL